MEKKIIPKLQKKLTKLGEGEKRGLFDFGNFRNLAFFYLIVNKRYAKGNGSRRRH
jgi:hypothetical protein